MSRAHVYMEPRPRPIRLVFFRAHALAIAYAVERARASGFRHLVRRSVAGDWLVKVVDL